MKFTKRDTESNGVGGESFLKIPAGTSVSGIFMGEIFEFWQKWPYGGEKQVFTNRAKAIAANAKSRFRLNFVTKDESGGMVAKVWEFGLGTYNDLAEIHAEYPLTETMIKITRKGEGKNTQYHLMPLLKQPLSKAQLAKIAEVKLHVLDVVAPVTAEEIMEPAEGDDDANIPF